jgi:hypothetical protein
MKTKTNAGPDATQELLLGTWQAIGLIGDALVRSGAIRRVELLVPLAAAQEMTHSLDRRHVAFGAVHGLINSVDDGHDPQPVRQSAHSSPRPVPRRSRAGERHAAPRWSHACRVRGTGLRS